MAENKQIFLSPPHMGGEEIQLVQEAFQSNFIAPVGPQIDAFEKEFCQKFGFSHAVALSSGTAAMHLALRLLEVGPGDTVIAPSLNFIGGVSPAIWQGASLVFIDSDKHSWNMDPELLHEEINHWLKRGLLPKAVISTDIFGQCANLDLILDICTKYNISVISDSAEALGATYRGRSAGVGAKAAVYSFNGNKIVTTSGGGMLASEDEEFINKAKFLSQQACDDAAHYEHSQIGYNYRMSNILAAIGRGQLKVIDERVEAKRKIFDRYKSVLAQIPGIEFMPEASYGYSNRWLTVILINPEEFGTDRNVVYLELKKQNIESRPIWKPMHMQKVFKTSRVRGGEVCENLFKRGLCLPSGTAMSDEDFERVTKTVLKCQRNKVTLKAESI